MWCVDCNSQFACLSEKISSDYQAAIFDADQYYCAGAQLGEATTDGDGWDKALSSDMYCGVSDYTRSGGYTCYIYGEDYVRRSDPAGTRAVLTIAQHAYYTHAIPLH